MMLLHMPGKPLVTGTSIFSLLDKNETQVYTYRSYHADSDAARFTRCDCTGAEDCTLPSAVIAKVLEQTTGKLTSFSFTG